MRRESLALVWDARRAADRVSGFVEGRTRADYEDDLMLRSAVERQLGIVGEALNRLGKMDPDTAERVPHFRAIVGFRNVLVHGYASIDNGLVWRTIRTSLPALIESLNALLDEGDGYGRDAARA